MTRWLLRRGADALATAVLAAVALTLLVHALPGDPLAALFDNHAATPVTEIALRERYCLDCSPLRFLARNAAGWLHGDLGYSISRQEPVTALLLERLGPTLLLGALTLLIDFTVGLALGLWAALHPRTWRARILGALSVAGYALPSFVLGMLLIWLFAVQLGWFPAAGLADPLLPVEATTFELVLDRARHLALPLLTLVLATIAVPLRQQRAATLAIVDAPWVRAAHARGVSPARIAWKHCWRPALTPIVTLFGLWLPLLVSGAVFVEALFAWPGIGSLIAEATAARDFPLVLGAGFLLIAAVQLGSFVADLLYRVVDPVQRG